MKRLIELKAASDKEQALKRLTETDVQTLRALEEQFLKGTQLYAEREAMRETIRQVTTDETTTTRTLG